MRAQLAWRAIFALAFAATLWIFFAPHLPAAADGPSGADKAFHALVFAGLAVLALPAFPRQAGWRLFLALVAYGVAVELAQTQIPGRGFEALDILADAAGSTVALIRRRG